MNILFLTLAYSLERNNLYTDLMDEFVKQGHSVFVCNPNERKSFGKTFCTNRNGVQVFSIPTGKITKTNFIQKGINTVLLEHRYCKSISQMDIPNIDVVIYSTPPITFLKVVKKVSKKFSSIKYLLLKDIFPQNALDLNIIKTKGLLYTYFRNVEKKLYQISDIIGCMSPANKKYLIEHNPEIDERKICLAYNCINPHDFVQKAHPDELLSTYSIPSNTVRFIYGGNLGKPQGISFLIECIDKFKFDSEIFFVIIGSGTEFTGLKKYLDTNAIKNVQLMKSLPKEKYQEILSCMDVGMIFLDHRFTIPNFPSRVLDYMDVGLPILACTDVACDVKQEICDTGAGFWCESKDVESFGKIVNTIKADKTVLSNMGLKSRELLIEKYNVRLVAQNMIEQVVLVGKSL
jgi:glycosyltransferase involved in cell wall biosynthesis